MATDNISQEEKLYGGMRGGGNKLATAMINHYKHLLRMQRKMRKYKRKGGKVQR